MNTKFVDYIGNTGRTKLEEISEWIAFQDLLDLNVNSKMHWDLMNYMPFTFLAFHTLFATAKRTVLQYPKQDYEVLDLDILVIHRAT